MIKIRKAQAADSADILAWRNDPATRQASFNSEPISAEAHQVWFQTALSGSERILYIGEDAERNKIGVVRLDLLGPNAAEININLAPARRGRGVGAELLEQVAELFRREEGAVFFIARIKKGNEASVKTFKKAGFYDLFSYFDKITGTEVLALGKLKK